jgi:ketosteroid isomerase-like protein
MSDLQAIADRVEIEALRGEFTDAAMDRDYDRFASLFTEDGAMRWPHINKEFVGREEIRAAIEQGQDLWDYFLQTTAPGHNSSRATSRPVVHTSQSSGGFATAART